PGSSDTCPTSPLGRPPVRVWPRRKRPKRASWAALCLKLRPSNANGRPSSAASGPRLLAVPSRAGQRLPHLGAHDVGEIDREIRDALSELGEDRRLTAPVESG